ncbi:MAG: ABC transporter permease, partial [Bryobacteraceae bacterium]
MIMLIQDLRHAVRLMAKDRWSTLAAIAILALGVGATTIVFSLANGLLLRPLPYSQTDRIVAVEEVATRSSLSFSEVAYPNYEDMRARTRLFQDMALYGEGAANILGEGEAERVPVSGTTDGLFDVLGVHPLMGRTYTRDEDRPKGPAVVVLGEDLWRRRYGSDPNIIGRVLNIGGKPTRVIGVMPASFRFPQVAEMWMPLQLNRELAPRTDHYLLCVALLKPGITVEQATAELQSMMRQINRENPTTDYGNSAKAIGLRESLAADYRLEVITLLGAVGFLLLIACANITNLLLVKASVRKREMAVRTALGASRPRLIRQLGTESILLGVTGGLCGLGLAYAGLPAMLRMLPANLPRWMKFTVDGRVLAFALGLSLLTSVLSGIVPALLCSRVDLSGALKEGSRGATTGKSRQAMRSALVVVEVALSLTLLTGAGLMVRSFL